MNFPKKLKVLLAWCIAVSMILSVAMPILAYANSGTPVISYNGKIITPRIEPYENNLGLMADAEDLAELFSFEYTANSRMKYFIIHHEKLGDVVLMHNATNFISGEDSFDCAPYFYYENGIPMIETGFFCEMFGAEYSLSGTEIIITEKAVLDELSTDALEASDTASYAATKAISGTASFDRNVTTPEGGIDVVLNISTFSDIRTTTYGKKYRDFQTTAEIGTIHFDKGEKSKNYSFSLRNFMYDEDYPNYIIYYTTEDTDCLYEDAYLGNDGKMHSYLYTYYGYYDCPDDAKVFSFRNNNTANIKLLTTDEFAKPVTGKAGDNLTWSLNKATGVLTISGKGKMHENLYYYLRQYSSAINSVVIKGGVTSIGPRAFYDLPITSITIPDSVTDIQTAAFHSCDQLTEIKLPGYLTSINSSAFHSCSGLKTITIPDSINPELLGASLFYGCSSLETIYAPAKIAKKQSNWKGSSNSAEVIYDCSLVYKLNGETVKVENVEPGITVDIPEKPDVPEGGKYILTVNGKPYTESTVTINGNTVINQIVITPASEIKSAIECNSFEKSTGSSSTYSYSCNVESIAGDDISGTAVVAMYDSTGRIVGIERKSLTSELSGQLSTDGDPESYKILILDTESLIPSSFCCDGILD